MPSPAALPNLTIPLYKIPLPGGYELPLDPWAILVCLGFVVGLEVARARGIKLGLGVRDIVDGAVVIGVVSLVVVYKRPT